MKASPRKVALVEAIKSVNFSNEIMIDVLEGPASYSSDNSSSDTSVVEDSDFNICFNRCLVFYIYTLMDL